MAIRMHYEVARTHSSALRVQVAADAALSIIGRIRGVVHDWRAARLLSGMDDGMLKDIGVSRGSIDWTVRNGRDGM